MHAYFAKHMNVYVSSALPHDATSICLVLVELASITE